MTKVRTLYHPKFEPRESWLRSMLLFYDTVHSIVPQDAGYTPSPGVAALQERVQNAFVPLVPEQEDVRYDWPDYKALTAVLSNLSERGGKEARVSARLDKAQAVPSIDLGGTVRVHHDKLALMLADDLVDFGLAERTNDPKWLSVDRRVADLVLSMLAERMAMNRPGAIYTSSDQETSFAVAAKSKLTNSRVWKGEATLASAILTAVIPGDIVDITLDRYLEIRKRYEDKREAFRLAMHELQTLYFEASFETPSEFYKELEEVVGKFDRQMQSLREQRFARRVRRWATIAIGGIVSVAAAAIADPTFTIAATAASLTIDVLKNAQGEQFRGTNVAQAQAILVDLERDLRWNRNWLGRVFSR